MEGDKTRGTGSRGMGNKQGVSGGGEGGKGGRGRGIPMALASPEAPPSIEAALTSRASSRALPGCALEPPALCTPALMVAKPTCITQ